jgi:acrylyl-CoA reductase (NADPH)
LGASEIIKRKGLAGPAKPLGKERWAGDRLDHARQCAFDDALRRGGAACGLAGGMDLPTSVAPFILRGASLLDIGSVMRPMADRRMA